MVTLVLIGVLIGLVLGLTGAGGSVFAVPLLILLAGFSRTDAVGLSLGTVAASTIYASVRRGLQQHTILWQPGDRKSTRLNSSHVANSYAVFCLIKKKCLGHQRDGLQPR